MTTLALLLALAAPASLNPAAAVAAAQVAAVGDADVAADRDVSVGVGLSWPEIALIYASVWPVHDVSIDGVFTLSTLNAGASYHLPIGGAHALLFQGLVGWTHSVVSTPYLNFRGVRFFGGVGYGHTASWDFRAVLGFSAAQMSPSAWGYMPEAFLTLGKVF